MMEYIGDQELLKVVNQIKDKIVQMNDETKQDLYEVLISYLEDNHTLNPDAIQYLCTGFILHRICGVPSVIPLSDIDKMA